MGSLTMGDISSVSDLDISRTFLEEKSGFEDSVSK